MLRQGRWDEAYEAFISALKLENFRYAEASYNLGRLYAARGQNDLAVREWRRALGSIRSTMRQRRRWRVATVTT